MRSKHKSICAPHSLLGPAVDFKSVAEIQDPVDFILNGLPSAFGAAYIKRAFRILDHAIGRGVPLIIAVAGPVTISNQHRGWLIPLIEAGWVAYLTTTDAVCYHDGHDSLEASPERVIREVAIAGKDREHRAAEIIRVTNTGFREQVLFDQDRMITACLRQPEMQRRMTGTEFRNLLGKYYDAQEKAFGVQPGSLSTCYNHSVPVFVGAPGDGSAFLNSVKLWALTRLGQGEHRFELDLHEEVFESCAYHYWALHHGVRKLGIWILGGGVPKNFSLQPEPTLSQILCLPNIRGYDFDVQIVIAPVTDGSLSSCLPEEAHTWGKVAGDALGKTVESVAGDYSMIAPLLAWGLLFKRCRFKKMAEELSLPQLLEKHPEAVGYLRQSGQLRLYDQRGKLKQNLLRQLGKPVSLKRLSQTLDFPLQLLVQAAS